MKKLFLLVAFVIGFTSINMAQTKPGEFKFDSEVHDFGKIVLGKDVTQLLYPKLKLLADVPYQNIQKYLLKKAKKDLSK
jgi:hypothetical protein